MSTEQSPPIEKFESFLESNLEKGSKVISFESKYLTKPGDNYGSCVLKVTVEIQKSSGLNETLELVAKLPPIVELFWKIFEPERTCITENAIYMDIVPALIKIQEDANVSTNDLLDVFPKCYGCRTTLSSTDPNKVDKDAVLLLENLIPLGYEVADRLESYDYQHSLIAIRDLAKYHAMLIAMRLLKPKEFEENIKPKFRKNDLNKNFGETLMNSMIENSVKDIKSISQYSSEEFIKKVYQYIKYSREYMENPNECEDSLFTTIAHSDFWVNNMMFVYDENKNPLKIKILDFQTAQYESLAHDVIFLIFSSIKSELINEKYDEFLHYYYDEFIKCLNSVAINTSEYSFEKFMAEIKRLAVTQFFHIITMFKVILIERDALPDDFNDMNENTLENDNAYSDKYFHKLTEFLNFYIERGYIDC